MDKKQPPRHTVGPNLQKSYDAMVSVQWDDFKKYVNEIFGTRCQANCLGCKKIIYPSHCETARYRAAMIAGLIYFVINPLELAAYKDLFAEQFEPYYHA